MQASELFSKNDSWVEWVSKRNSEALASPVVPFANEATLYIFENIHGMSLSLNQRILYIVYLEDESACTEDYRLSSATSQFQYLISECIGKTWFSYESFSIFNVGVHREQCPLAGIVPGNFFENRIILLGRQSRWIVPHNPFSPE